MQKGINFDYPLSWAWRRSVFSFGKIDSSKNENSLHGAWISSGYAKRNCQARLHLDGKDSLPDNRRCDKCFAIGTRTVSQKSQSVGYNENSLHTKLYHASGY